MSSLARSVPASDSSKRVVASSRVDAKLIRTNTGDSIGLGLIPSREDTKLIGARHEKQAKHTVSGANILMHTDRRKATGNNIRRPRTTLGASLPRPV